MASPVADSYACDSGGRIVAGRPPLGALDIALMGMAAGDWMDWSSATNVAQITDTTGPTGLPTAWLETVANLLIPIWPGKATWDERHGRIVLVGTSQGYVTGYYGQYSAAVYLDVRTGIFSKKWNPFAGTPANPLPIGHVYDGNCSLSLAGKVYRKAYPSATLFTCSLENLSWSVAKDISSLNVANVASVEVFPDLGAQGSVLFLWDLANGSNKLARWDIATNALSVIGTYSGISAYAWMHYVPSSRSVVFGSGTNASSIYRLDAAGTVSLITNVLPTGLAGTGSQAGYPCVADPAGRDKSWLFADKVYDLDHPSGIWTSHGNLPADLTISYGCPCALHGHGTIMVLEGHGRGSGVSLSQIWLYGVP